MIQLLFQGQIVLFTLILFSLILSLTFHEYGHGIMAKYFGDLTAEKQGRLTLNPIAHIDPMGLLMVIFIGFGFAKPVPTDPRNYSSRWGVLFVAAAGPFMNLLVAFITINLYGLGLMLDWSLFDGQAANNFFIFLASINMLLMVFNLIPIGPLDGHYILPYFLPTKFARFYLYYNQRYGNWFLLSIVALALMGVPIFNYVWEFGQWLLSLIILF
ncbi:MAG: site-2 protease family protein [Gammaproteobacteria bacterium]|jgi:Zn-dependent protease|nr:site-2 protease family protein [Gammaproteobacteria bacterium]MBT3722372.1 site-2 protease family protein [Gammaproteobacteria bacterium]MBT4075318.1 site-2 protease family protein [Gammaproteobacteria bacterium]MBT4193242.1 site-2 protease family protein [Gammaproteobacteria bacterium]MBT4450945.1 site-2 protease family protein [Gammaproteobacteria bacterium]